MGKVKDDLSAAKPAKNPKVKPGGGPPSMVTRFFLNFLQTGLYKPMQGWNARLWTAIGLGVIVLSGVYLLYQSVLDYEPMARLSIPTVVLLALGWAIFRLVQFPPFAEFLIATEAEMNKVSWTSKDDLYRATTVVLTTVVLMAVFLFVVDWLWLFILRNIGVLQFAGGGGFGSTA
ncbi:preprotein translocase subunit SecE [Aquisphaera giovannonii]|uniref:Protein translocase subunit SecE n=1 Tax=Aquisphaera giovannonii TaxID=406548 RepID=A0A5B9VX81_9BACT|nr:preprotein translocase subunit SecE [Aquisphaera giovannonii]QEH32471.1 preprotein translocase subunit SecE [Aquisphaera giovannonii]